MELINFDNIEFIYNFILLSAKDYWYIVALLFLSKIFRELEDEAMKNHFKGKLAKWNTINSWTNKWALVDGQLQPFTKTYWNIGKIKILKQWYYFTFYPKFKEKRIYSSSLFVFVTDAEHFFQFLSWRFLDLAAWLFNPVFGIVFTLGHLIGSLTKEKIRWIN